MTWYREWESRELGTNGNGKLLCRKYWDDDEPPFLATYRRMKVLDVLQDGSLWCEYKYYGEGSSLKKQKVRLDGTVVEQIQTKKDPVSRVYIREDGQDIGFLWPVVGEMGRLWIPHRPLKNGSIALHGSLSMSEARQALREDYARRR